MCLCIKKKKINEEAVLTHLVYIIKFLVANHIAHSPSIPEHISDISLAEKKISEGKITKQASIVFLFKWNDWKEQFS